VITVNAENVWGRSLKVHALKRKIMVKKLTPCPICCQLVGHNKALHNETAKRDKAEGRQTETKKDKKKLWLKQVKAGDVTFRAGQDKANQALALLKHQGTVTPMSAGFLMVIRVVSIPVNIVRNPFDG